MKQYTDCQTYHTGLYKPHTIQLADNIRVPIVYYDESNVKEKTLVAIATDTANNKYNVYKTVTAYGNIGYLAFPVDPDKIKGFFPWF